MTFVGTSQFWEKINEVLKESRQHQKMGSMLETKENQHQGKAVPKWTNCYGAVGKWTKLILLVLGFL
jgi:hypothetical protein